MTTNQPSARTRAWTVSVLRRPLTGGVVLVVVLGLIAAVMAALTVSNSESVDAAAPVFGEPDVLPPVDLDSLAPDPISQWGVVGEGNTYTAPKSLVWDFQEIGDRIFVAGIFTGVQRNGDDSTSQVFSQPYLAAFDRDSGDWIPSFTPTLDRAVYALETSSDGNLVVGGEFTLVNGVARGGLVKLNPITGATVAAFPTRITAGNQPMVRDIVRVGSQLYIAGQISNVYGPNGAPWVWNAARVNEISGAVDLAWIPQFFGGIWQLAHDPVRNRVTAAGFFTSVGGAPSSERVATVSATTGALVAGLTPFEFNQPNGQKDTVAVVYADDKLYVGGAQHVVAVLDATTNTRIGHYTAGIACDGFVPTCGYSGGGDIQTLEVVAGGKVIAGCHCFTANTIRSSFQTGTFNNRHTFSVNTTGNAISSTFIPGVKQRSVGVYSIFVDSRGCYYVGGDYTRQEDGQWLGGFGRMCAPAVAPSSLSATSTNGGAALTWSAPTGPLPVKYYKVYRDGVFAGDTFGTSFGFTGLAVGSTPTFTVRALDAAGRLSPAATATVTINGADTVAPSVPADVVGSAVGSDVTLTWTASVDNAGGAGLSGYLLHRDWQFVKLIPAGATSTTDLGVADGNHRYELRAVDKANNISAPSTAINVTVGTPDTLAPTVPANVVTSAAGSTVNVSWNPSVDLPNPGGVGLSGYLIHRDWNYVAFIPSGTTAFTDTGVADGNRRYEVRAVDLGGRISAPSTPSIVTVGTPDSQAPTVPANLTGSVAGGAVTLNWAASADLPAVGAAGLSGYLIHRDWNYLAFVPAGTTTFVDSAPGAGSRRYEVRAVDLLNNISAPSTPLNIVVP